MRRLRPLQVLVSAFSLLGLTYGCSDSPEEEIVPLEIVTFEADPTEVDAGQTVTLTYSLRGAERFEIFQQGAGPLQAPAGESGTVQSMPVNLTTTFTLTATSASGEVRREQAVVNARGISIVSFTASPMTINRGESSELRWRLGGSTPSEVVVEDSTGAPLLDPNQDRTGMVSVSPERTETYTLRAQAEGSRAMATVSVQVTIVPPTIDRFEARAVIGGTPQVVTTVFKGRTIDLEWTVRNLEEVQISANGAVVQPWNSSSGTGRRSTTATEDRNVYLLEACNSPTVNETCPAEALRSQELVITTQERPTIDTLTVAPMSFTEGSTTATVQWQTTNSNRTALLVNGREVSGFPGTTSGSFMFTVTGATNITLIARNAVGESTQSVQIALGYSEREPNDRTRPIILTGDGSPVRGTIADSSDEDWYALMVGEGEAIFARVDDDSGGNCATLDPTLELYDAAGQLLGRRTQAGVTNCAEMLPPEFASFAENLTAGMYFLRVTASGTGMQGQYALTARPLVPNSPPPNITTERMGTPPWEVSDFILVSVLAGTTTSMFSELNDSINSLINTRHTLGGYAGITAIVERGAASPTNFRQELQLMSAARGLVSKGTFTAAEYNAPNGLLLGMSIVPSATATVGSSRDFPAAPFGPVIPNGRWPITYVGNITVNGMDLGDFPAVQYNPDAAASGISHQNILTALVGAVLPGNPMPPFDASIALSIMDNAGQGYTITLPFRVN